MAEAQPAQDFFGAPPPPATPQAPGAATPGGQAPADFFGMQAPSKISVSRASSPLYDAIFGDQGTVGRYINPVSRILGAFGQSEADAWGSEPLGLSPEQSAQLTKAGIFNDYTKNRSSLIKTFNEALIRPAAVAFDAANRAMGGFVSGAEEASARAGVEADPNDDIGFSAGGQRYTLQGLGKAGAAYLEYKTSGGGFSEGALGHGLAEAAATKAEIDSRPPPVDLRDARALGVIGEGEEGYMGTAEPTADHQAKRAEAVRQQLAEAKETGAPAEPQPLSPGTPAVETPVATGARAAQPDLNAAVRAKEPVLFNEWEGLQTRVNTFRNWLTEMADERRKEAEAAAPHADEIADLQDRMDDATPRLQKKYQARIAAMEAEREDFIEEKARGDSADMARVRAELQKADYRMRDLAPDVAKTYREAAGPEAPESVTPNAYEKTVGVNNGPEGQIPGGLQAAPGDMRQVPGEAARQEPALVPAVQGGISEALPAGAPPAAAKQSGGREVPADIEADATARLQAIGMPKEQADAHAAVIKAYYTTRSQRFGGKLGTPQELYAARMPDIVNEAQARRQPASQPSAEAKALDGAEAAQSAPPGRDGRTFLQRLVGKAAERARDTPGLRAIAPYLQADELAKLRRDTAAKLVNIFSKLPSSAEMASVAWAGRAKRGWYRHAADAIRTIFGEDSDRFSALLAATSPQASVESNLKNALQTWVNWDKEGRPTDEKSINQILGRSVQGTMGEQFVLEAWRQNVVRALTAADPAKIVISGPKVNSFMLNLRSYMNEVTNDGWMATYAAVRPDLFRKTGPIPGKSVGYVAMSAAVRRAADILTRRTGQVWTPAEIQETVWSWAKALYERRDRAGEDRTTQEILKAADLTHEDVEGTSDFASLMVQRIFRKILEEGGYGGQLGELERSTYERQAAARRTGAAVSTAEPEGAGIAGPAFERHLQQAAARLERVRDQRIEEAGGVPTSERAREARASEIAANLSASTDSIPGLKRMAEAANAGDVSAARMLNLVAHDAITRLMSGIPGVKIEVSHNGGLYGGALEPSLGVKISFDEKSRPAVLAALAKFAENFNQHQIHVRQETIDKPGRVYTDGSYVTPVAHIELKRPLDRAEVQHIIDHSGLDGLTFGDDHLEAYYVGDPRDAGAIEEFRKAVGRANDALGDNGGDAEVRSARFWAYGEGGGATHGYDAIRGDIPEDKEQFTQVPRALAEEATGRELTPAEIAKEITPAQRKLQERIAADYEDLPDNDLGNPLVKRAYDELVKEINKQFEKLPIKVDAWAEKDENGRWVAKGGEPYKNSAAMRRDVLNNNHLYFFITDKDQFGPPGSDFSGHPLLEKSGHESQNGYPMNENDVLRVVHDYYAHLMNNAQFGPRGEEAAWRNHVATLDNGWARWALTSETRGQNSWVNFGSHVDPETPLSERPFARQKVALLPVEDAMTGDDHVDLPMWELSRSLSPQEARGSQPEPEYFQSAREEQVASPEFKSWFGNSKVVDEGGKPKVVYHTTTAGETLTSFRRRLNDVGIHFGTKGQAEDRFALKAERDPYGPQLRGTSHATIPVYLSIQKPLRLHDMGNFDAENLSSALRDDPNSAFTKEEITSAMRSSRSHNGQMAALRRLIERKGYDGIVYTNLGEAGGAAPLRAAQGEATAAMAEAQRARGKSVSAYDIEDQQTPEYKAHREAYEAYHQYLATHAEDSYIAFRPEQIKSAIGNSGEFDPRSKNILAQGKRGSITLRQTRNLIRLTESGDASSLIHEEGHDWLEQLMRDAVHEEAPPELQQDAKTVRNWLGAQEHGIITRAQHEKFARGFERYVMEGVAPSKELASVFAKFRQWLLDIYKTVTRLRSPINDEIRGVFDRMLAMKPEKTVFAPDVEPAKSMADIHEADAETTRPEHAGAVADTIKNETDTIARQHAPEVHDAFRAAETPEEPASPESGAGAPSGGVEGAGAAEPVAGAAPAPAEPAAVDERGNETAGAGSDVRAEPSGAGRDVERATGREPERATERFGDVAAPHFDKAGNIRLDTLGTPEDVNDVIKQAAADGREFVASRRGVITDAEAIQLADALGMSAADLNLRKIGQAFNSEQILAARKLLIQSAVAVRDLMAKAAIGTDADVMAYAEAKARHMMIQEQVAGLTAEAGRALRAFRSLEGSKEAQSITTFLQSATGKTVEDLRREAKAGAALDTPQKLSKYLMDSRKPTFSDMVLEYWINCLISGPATHTTYMVGNFMLALSRATLETGAAATVGAAREAIAGHPIDRVYFGEIQAQLYGMLYGSRTGVFAAGKAAMSGLTTLLPGEEYADFALQKGAGSIPDYKVAGIPVPVGTVARLPSRGVAAIHSFYRAVGYSQSIAAQAFRIATREGLVGDAKARRIGDLTTSPTEEMMGKGRRQATEQTLMGKGGEFTQNLARFTNSKWLGVPVMKFVMPFIKIGSNIMGQGLLERTPLGLLDPEIRANVSGANGPVARDEQIGRMVVGSAIGLTFIGLAMEGKATGGGPSDPKEAAIFAKVHGPPYSVKIGDTWYGIHRLGPLAVIAGVAADMWEYKHAVDTKSADQLISLLVTSITKGLLDETWMRGSADLIQAMEDPQRYGAKWARDEVSSFLPFSVGMGQEARAIDPYQREARTIMDSIKAKIPWLSETLLPRRDVFGDPVPNKEALGVDGLSAIYETKANNDPVYKALDDARMYPSLPERKIRGQKLSDEEYDDYVRISGKMMKIRMGAIVKQPGFAALPVETRHDMLAEAEKSSREIARSVIMMHNPQIIRGAIAAKRAEVHPVPAP